MRQDSRVFILRHDVDSPFVYRKNLFKKIMNRVYLSKPKLPGKEHLPGYHEALRNTLELEEKYNAKGTFFFRTVTCPPPDLVKKIINDKHEIGRRTRHLRALRRGRFLGRRGAASRSRRRSTDLRFRRYRADARRRGCRSQFPVP